MKTIVPSFFILSLPWSGSAHAQFPLAATSATPVHQLKSLSAGDKLIELFFPGDTLRTIHNLDLSVYRQLTVPPPPATMQWSSMSYITDALFDTDTSTIEYLIIASTSGVPSAFAVSVFREDGTQLFVQNPGSIMAAFAPYPHGYEAIFTEGGQTYMLLSSGILNPPMNLYLLPGSLPCMDCQGSSTGPVTGGGPDQFFDPASGMSVYPNPAGTTAIVALGIYQGMSGSLHLADAAGRIVQQHTLAGGTHVELALAGLATGSYHVSLLIDGAVVSSLPLVVSR